jgi:hypothetical protein
MIVAVIIHAEIIDPHISTTAHAIGVIPFSFDLHLLYFNSRQRVFPQSSFNAFYNKSKIPSTTSLSLSQSMLKFSIRISQQSPIQST